MGSHTHKVSRRTFFGGAAAFGVVSLVNPILAFAIPTSAEKQAEADSVRAQVMAMQDELEQASNDYYAAIDEHDAALASMEECQDRIDKLGGKIGAVQGSLGTRARSMYRNGSASFLDILFGSNSFEEFATNWDLLNRMNEKDADMVQECKDLRDEVELEQKEFAAQETIAAEKEAETLAIKKQTEATVVEMQALLDSLDEEARQLLEAEEQAAAEARAAAEAEAMAAAARERAANEETENASYDNDSSGSGGGSSNQGGGESSGGGYTGNGKDIPTNGSVVDYAVSRLGCPYVYGASGPNTFDCSGLTSWCYAQAGIWIPRTDSTQKAAAKAILAVSDAAAGDVVHRSGHVGIYVGGGSVIHAPRTGEVVSYTNASGFSCALRF